MDWLIPSVRRAMPVLRRMAGKNRRRLGYWREYHAKNYAKRRPYLTEKAREYRGRTSTTTQHG